MTDTPGYEAEPEEARAVFESEIDDIAAGWPGDPLPRYAALSARQAHYQSVANGLSGARAAVLADMHDKGMSYARIAEATGMTRARVQQLVEKGRFIALSGEYDQFVRPHIR